MYRGKRENFVQKKSVCEGKLDDGGLEECYTREVDEGRTAVCSPEVE